MANLSLFSQIISKLDLNIFSKIVKEKNTDKHQKGFSSWTHLVSMLFCQFAKSQSVRDNSNSLYSATSKLNHLGIVIATTLSDRNNLYKNEIVYKYFIQLMVLKSSR